MDATKSLSIYFLLLATMLVHCQGWKKPMYPLEEGAPKNKPCYSWMCKERTITTISTPLDQNLAESTKEEDVGTTLFFALMCVGIILVKHTDIIFIFVSLQL
jgi:hypothetical protein